MAVARGATLEVRGPGLMIAEVIEQVVKEGEQGVEEKLVPVGSESLSFSLRQGQVSSGKHKGRRLLVASEKGRLSINGIQLLGRLEVSVEKGGLLAVDRVDIEDYVASVVGGEVPISWPQAALQAQAIAARTFVLRRKLEGARSAHYHVEASVLDQVYRGGAAVDSRTREAAQATYGQVLTFRHQLAEAYFFSSCTGQTEAGGPGLGRELPYLISVPCEGGEAASNAAWEQRFAVGALSKKFRQSGTLGDELQNIEIAARTPSGRVAKLRLITRRSSRELGAGEFRKLVGYRELPSLDFRVEKQGGTLIFKGSGAGHAVGLCQWCAKSQAEAGEGAESILRHFYPGTEVLRMY